VINQHTKFKISKFTHYEDMKGKAKCSIFGGLGVRVDRSSENRGNGGGVDLLSVLCLTLRVAVTASIHLVRVG